MISWAATAGMPVHVLITKADKLKRGPAKSTLLSVRARLMEYGELASVQLFSSLKRDGLKELEGKLKSWLTDESVFDEPENDDADTSETSEHT